MQKKHKNICVCQKKAVPLHAKMCAMPARVHVQKTNEDKYN